MLHCDHGHMDLRSKHITNECTHSNELYLKFEVVLTQNPPLKTLAVPPFQMLPRATLAWRRMLHQK